MAAGHGGSRTGSGRPKSPASGRKAAATARDGAASPPQGGTVKHYDDALTYLEAVVRGDETADPLRIAAARIVLPYQSPKTRAPVESPPPSTLRVKERRAKASSAAEDWEKRAAAVKARFKKGVKDA